MRQILVAGLLLALTAGCGGSPTAPSEDLPVRLTLAPGASAQIADTDLTLRFEGVRSDSRCPSDALCIHPGDAEVAVMASGPARGLTFTLLVNDRSRSAVDVDGYRVTLEVLSPYPRAGVPIASDAYRVTLVVSRP